MSTEVLLAIWSAPQSQNRSTHIFLESRRLSADGAGHIRMCREVNQSDGNQASARARARHLANRIRSQPPLGSLVRIPYGPPKY